jgi:hypothetical protein
MNQPAYFNVVISNIKAKYAYKTQGNKHRKNLVSIVNVIQKFQKAVQMCELPYIQVGHGTQLLKSVPSHQNWDVRSGGKMLICSVRNLFYDLEKIIWHLEPNLSGHRDRDL